MLTAVNSHPGLSMFVLASFMAELSPSIIIAVALRVFPLTALAALLAVPLAVQACRVALRHYDDLPHLTPANAATVGVHLLTSVLLGLGFFFAGVIPH